MNPGIIQIVAAPLSSLSSNKNITQWRDLEHNPDSSLSLKSTSNLELLVNQFNNATPQIIVMTLKKILYSNIMTQRKCITLEIPHKNKSVPLLHILACSLNKNFDDLQHLLSCTKTKFDIITINETRIAKEVCLSNNLNLNNYSFKFIPTESCAGVTLLYIVNHLSYKCRSDLNIYKK